MILGTKKQKITISLDTQVYEAIKAKVGARKIGEYLSSLARPQLERVDYSKDLEAGYRAMAADEQHEREAQEWTEGILEPVVGDNNWSFKIPKSWQ